MLLAMDVGNTNTVLGVFRGTELIANWRLTTARDQTVDEYGVLTRNLFTIAADYMSRRWLASLGAAAYGVSLIVFGTSHSLITLVIAAFCWGAAGDAFVHGCEVALVDLAGDDLGNPIGVALNAANNTVGGTAAGAANVIAFGTTAGVSITAGTMFVIPPLIFVTAG